MTEKKNLKSYTYNELEALVRNELGEPSFRAKQIFEWLYRGVDSYDEMSNLSKEKGLMRHILRGI